jgi:hypothetical protein
MLSPSGTAAGIFVFGREAKRYRVGLRPKPCLVTHTTRGERRLRVADNEESMICTAKSGSVFSISFLTSVYGEVAHHIRHDGRHSVDQFPLRRRRFGAAAGREALSRSPSSDFNLSITWSNSQQVLCTVLSNDSNSGCGTVTLHLQWYSFAMEIQATSRRLSPVMNVVTAPQEGRCCGNRRTRNEHGLAGETTK